MGAVASQITNLTIVYSTVYSDADQRKHQSSASLAFVWGIHRGPVNSPHKWPVTRKIFPFDDVIMLSRATKGVGWRLLTLCEDNSPAIGGLPLHRANKASFHVFFDFIWNNRLNKHPSCRWSGTLWYSLLCACNVFGPIITPFSRIINSGGERDRFFMFFLPQATSLILGVEPKCWYM